MTEGPSMKGATIQLLVEDAAELLARSGAERERLESELGADTLALLTGKLDLARWYPIAQYNALSELLWRVEGGGDVGYLHRRGENIMRRLMDAGLYQQLEYLGRMDSGARPHVTRDDLMRTCRLVGSITGTIRNFGRDRWEWDRERPGHMLHHVHEAADFPEVLRFVSEGAETYLVRLHRPDAPAVTSTRRAPDHIVFTSDYSGALHERS